MYRYILIFIALVVFILAVSFHLKNDHVVTLNYYLATIDLPLSMVVIGCLIIGMVLGMILFFPRIIGLKAENLRLKKQNEIKQQEVNNLRTLPVKDEH